MTVSPFAPIFELLLSATYESSVVVRADLHGHAVRAQLQRRERDREPAHERVHAGAAARAPRARAGPRARPRSTRARR